MQPFDSSRQALGEVSHKKFDCSNIIARNSIFFAFPSLIYHRILCCNPSNSSTTHQNPFIRKNNYIFFSANGDIFATKRNNFQRQTVVVKLQTKFCISDGQKLHQEDGYQPEELLFIEIFAFLQFNQSKQFHDNRDEHPATYNCGK